MLTNIAIIVVGLVACIVVSAVHVSFTQKHMNELDSINKQLNSIQHSIGDKHVR